MSSCRKNFNSSGNSDDIFCCNSFTSEMNYRTKSDSLRDDDIIFRKKKKAQCISSRSSDICELESFSYDMDNKNMKCSDVTKVSTESVSTFDNTSEEKLKRYIFGDVKFSEDFKKKCSEGNITKIDESNCSTNSILSSSDDELSDKHLLPKRVGVTDSVKKALIKNWLNNVSLHNSRISSKNEDILNDSQLCRNYKKNVDDEFRKVLDETTNTIRNSLCVTPKTNLTDKEIDRSADELTSSTPKKKLFCPKNNGSFDGKENIPHLDAKSGSSTKSGFREKLVNGSFIGTSKNERFPIFKEGNNLLNSPGSPASPAIRNESKRRKTNNRLIIPSEFKLYEYKDSPIHKERDCENYFTDSDDEVGNALESDSFNKKDQDNILAMDYNAVNDENEEGMKENACGIDLEDSFDRILKKKKKMRSNPLNYSDEINNCKNTSLEDNDLQIVITEECPELNSVQNPCESVSLPISNSSFTNVDCDFVHENTNNSVNNTRIKNGHEENFQNSRNSDFISSLFTDCSGKGENTENIVKIEGKLESELKNSHADASNNSMKESEIINISDSSNEANFDEGNFYGDSFDEEKYFRSIRAENEQIPSKETKKLNLTSQVYLPSFSNNDEHTSFLLSLNHDIGNFICHPDAEKYKDSFQKNKDGLIDILFKLYNKEIFENKLPVIEISWSGHLTTTSGITKSSSRINKNGKKERKSCIKLSKTIVRDAGKLRDVLLHEMCHAANWLVDEHSDHHGPLFTKWTKKARRRFPEIPKVSTCHRYELNYKYKYRCTFCGYEVGRMKLLVKEFTCKLCGGRVKVDCK